MNFDYQKLKTKFGNNATVNPTRNRRDVIANVQLQLGGRNSWNDAKKVVRCNTGVRQEMK